MCILQKQAFLLTLFLRIRFLDNYNRICYNRTLTTFVNLWKNNPTPAYLVSFKKNSRLPTRQVFLHSPITYQFLKKKKNPTSPFISAAIFIQVSREKPNEPIKYKFHPDDFFHRNNPIMPLCSDWMIEKDRSVY